VIRVERVTARVRSSPCTSSIASYSARSSGTPNARGNSGAGNVGGGYDPYGKDVTRGKPTGRKP